MKVTGMLFIFIFLVSLSVSLPGQERHIIKYRYFLLSDNPGRLVGMLRKFTAKSNGYVKYFSGKKIVLRIPGGSMVNFKKFISKKTYIVDEQVFRNDVTVKIIELQTKLRVKERLLKDFYKLFNGSKFHQTLDLEREIGRVILEIEKIKGQLNYYDDITLLPEIIVSINKEGSAVRKSASKTRRDWIRRLGAPGLMNLY